LVFLVSGAMHEYFVWIVTGSWEWLGYMFAFFMIHAIACNVEAVLFPSREKVLPWGVSVILMQMFLMITAPLFFQPLEVFFASLGFNFSDKIF